MIEVFDPYLYTHDAVTSLSFGRIEGLIGAVDDPFDHRIGRLAPGYA
jgi:hypothetical protein